MIGLCRATTPRVLICTLARPVAAQVAFPTEAEEEVARFPHTGFSSPPLLERMLRVGPHCSLAHPHLPPSCRGRTVRHRWWPRPPPSVADTIAALTFGAPGACLPMPCPVCILASCVSFLARGLVLPVAFHPRAAMPSLLTV
eukprot:9504045-Pyramimonas_sp.AAC.2